MSLKHDQCHVLSPWAFACTFHKSIESTYQVRHANNSSYFATTRIPTQWTNQQQQHLTPIYIWFRSANQFANTCDFFHTLDVLLTVSIVLMLKNKSKLSGEWRERERKCGLNGGGIRNRCPWESLSMVVLVWERHQWGAIEPVSRPSINLNKSSVELRSHRVYLHNCNLLERFWNAWHASDLLFSNFHEWNCFLSEEFCIIVIGSKSNDHYC